MRDLIQKLIDSDISAYEIEKQTGFSRDTLSKIRNGHASIDNISLGKAEDLYKYAVEKFESEE